MNKQPSDFFLFTEEENNALNSRVEVRQVRGEQKDFVECLVRNKSVQLKPEERVRQLWLARLVEDFGYPLSRIQVEFPITFGRDSSKRADIVIFDADRPTVPYIIIEVKKDKLIEGKNQLKSYAHATGAPLALWSNGVTFEVWERRNPNYFEPIHSLSLIHI